MPASAATYTASFTTQYLLTTAASPTAGGSVTPATTYYNAASVVPVSATANSGYAFQNWSGDLTGSANPTSITMSAPRTVTGNFGRPVTVATSPAGLSITVDAVTYTAPQTFAWTEGSTHSIGVTTPQGTGGTRYAYASWSDSGAATHNITVPASAATYTASFTTQYLLTTAASPTAGGSVTPVTGYYNSASVVPVSANANSGYEFKNWSGDLTGSANPTSITMSGPRSVTGNFGPPAFRFVPITPCRVADTRNAAGPFGGPALAANTPRDFAIPAGSCGIPSNASAYSFNVTVAPIASLLYLTMWPTGQPQPAVSTLNALDGRWTANAAIVPAGTSGSVSVFASDATHVVLDINGYFVPAATSGALSFYPLTPCRVLDTRSGASIGAGATRTVAVRSSSCSVPASAVAYSLNFTALPQGPLGWITTWPTGAAMPTASTLNAPTGTITANAAILPAGTSGSVNVYASDATHLLVDINGYFAPPGTGGLSFYTLSPCRVADTRNANGPFGGPALLGSRDYAVPASACNVPGGAQAYSLNATVWPATGFLNWLTLWPAGAAMPGVSTLNSWDGRLVANAAIVPTTTGSISAYASDLTTFIFDIDGYFAP